jgi:hypothetical protein
MFDRIRKVFAKEGAVTRMPEETQLPVVRVGDGPVSEWAATQGFGFSADSTGHGLALEGKLRGKRWRMELGRPAREFIRGQELRARAQLGLDEDLAVLVMSRPLRESLEKKAFQIYTDHLRTSADPNLPEEMRWLAMFDEMGWDSLPGEFWARYSVLSDRRETALAWIDPQLAELMMDWPDPAPTAEVPFMILLLRGKAYLRMEYTPANVATLQHASVIFTRACESALSAFPAAPPAA